ncbi:MAG TPA: GldG family protein, partial [Kofleriaceae bacterium]|nr:GldG family protein [Kofleriaceae bacterium]
LGYLRSPVALVVAAAFLVLEGVSFAALVANLADPARPAPLGAVLEGHVAGGFVHWALQLAVLAALAARLADERRAGTWEAMVTAPVAESAAVVGAWLAGVALYAALWLSTLAYLFVLAHYAPGGALMDPGPVASAYVGEIAVGAAGLALALAASGWTQHTVAATVAGLGVLLAWLSAGELPALVPSLAAEHPTLVAALAAAGPRPVLATLARGEVRLDSALVLVALVAGGLRIATALGGVGRRRGGAVGLGALEGGLVAASIVLAGVLAGRAIAPRDVTRDGRNSLAATTRAVLARVDEPVTIAVLRPQIDQLAPIYDEVDRLLRRMARVQPALRVSRIDPAADPEAVSVVAATSALDEHQLVRGGALLLSRGARRRAVALLDLAAVGRDALAAPAVSSLRAEAAISQALAELVDDQPVTVCAVGGHGGLLTGEGQAGDGGAADPGAGATGPADPWAPVAARLAADGIGVDTIDLGGAVPATCRILAVIGPVRPLSGDQALAVNAFLAQGGGVLVALSGRDVGGADQPRLPANGLEAVLGAWGIEAGDRWIVDDDATVPLPLGFRVVDGYGAHPITAGFAGRRATIWQATRALAVHDVAGVRATVLVATGPHGHAVDGTGPTGRLALAVAAERGAARLVVLASAESIATDAATRGTGG